MLPVSRRTHVVKMGGISRGVVLPKKPRDRLMLKLGQHRHCTGPNESTNPSLEKKEKESEKGKWTARVTLTIGDRVVLQMLKEVRSETAKLRAGPSDSAH